MRGRTLRHQITLQQRGSTPDALGQESQTWSDVATLYAHAEPLAGREFFAAGQTQAAADVRFTIRHRTGVLPGMRVLWGGVPHDIVAPPIDLQGRREYLELMCTTGVRDGR